MKEVIISGSTGNLGVAVCRQFLENDFAVHATIRPGNPGHPIDDDNLKTHALDLLNENDCTDFVAAFNACPHVAVLCAGGFAMGDLDAADSSSLDNLIALNFKTAYHLIRPLWRRWQNEGIPGRLFVIGARPAMEPFKGKGAIAYTISKGMLLQLAKILRATAPDNSQQIFVCVPDTMDTPQNRKSMPDADQSKWVNPNDIAEWICTIADKEASGFSQEVIKFYGTSN